jgi:hypothetical protein
MAIVLDLLVIIDDLVLRDRFRHAKQDKTAIAS